LTEKPSKTEYHWICYTASANPSFKENYSEISFSLMQLAHTSSIHFDVVIDSKSKEMPRIRPVLEGKLYKHAEVL